MNSFRGTLLRPQTGPLAKIPIYATHADRDALRAACRFNAEVMDFLRPHVRPGISTREIDQLAYGYTLEHGHTPACLGYNGYPNTVCTSVNEVVCHGVPGDYDLRDGELHDPQGWHRWGSLRAARQSADEPLCLGKMSHQLLK